MFKLDNKIPCLKLKLVWKNTIVMARLTILTPKELQTVYAIPQFSDEERDTYFSIDPQEKQNTGRVPYHPCKNTFHPSVRVFQGKETVFCV